jgi:hypothetical protein
MPAIPSLYDQAMAASKKRRMESVQRRQTGISEVNGLMDLLDSMAAVGGGGGNPPGDTNPDPNITSNRNYGISSGPSAGGIPNMSTWKWRDPIDDQLFRVTTAAGTKKNFKGLLRDLARTGYDVDSLGGYNHRNVAGTSRLSEHAYGRAIDINPGANPMGSSLVTDMPKNVARLAALNDLVWGGTWRSKKDAMHFSTTGY